MALEIKFLDYQMAPRLVTVDASLSTEAERRAARGELRVLLDVARSEGLRSSLAPRGRGRGGDRVQSTGLQAHRSRPTARCSTPTAMEAGSVGLLGKNIELNNTPRLLVQSSSGWG
jgi:hypothetical protein